MLALSGMLLLLAAASPGYVGAKACRGCHADVHDHWNASRHSKMVRPASPEGVRGDFAVKEVSLRGESYRFEAKDGKYFITESRLLGKRTRHRILYTLGNRRIQHYLTKLEDGRIVVLPPSWDVLRKEWFHNMEIVGPEPETGVAVQVWNLNCFGCHVSQEEKNFDLATRSYDTDWVDFGTSCERCHGPGAEHVALYTSSRSPTDAGDSAIVVQTRLDPERSTATCGQCHSLRDAISLDFVAGGDYYDFFFPQLEYALPQDHDPAWYVDGSTRRFSNDTLGLWLSRCYLEGGVTCVDCHTDPHDTEIEKNSAIRPESKAICTRCHEAVAKDVPAHTRHPAASAGSSCVECHMPRSVVSIKAKIRDHGISLPAPENTERHGIPNACNNCHEDRTPAWAAETIDSWFPGSRARRQKLLDRADVFSRAKAGNDPEVVERLVALAANESEPPLIRANAVGYLGSFPADPRVQPALLRAFASKERVIRAVAMPQIGKLRPSRVESVTPFLVRALDDEAATVRMGAAFALVTLGVQSLEGDAAVKFETAKKLYAERAATSPDHAPTQLALGKFYVLNHDLASAAAAFERSLKLDPDQKDAVYYRAIARLGEGRTGEALDLLRQVGKESSLYASAQALLSTLSQR
jgi:predicted CXXCH cytochrome family protein